MFFPKGSFKMKELPSLGRCCNCGKYGKDVDNVTMMAFRSPTPGKGWGCAVCGLRSDGALLILCDDCQAELERTAENIRAPEKGVLSVCWGWPDEDIRMPWPAFERIPFHHDDELHETNLLYPAHTLN